MMDYDAYLQSAHWLAVREWALERADHRCQLCNDDQELDVHHRTYENLGRELPEDLIVLCRACHGIFHREGRLRSVPPAVRTALLEAIETTFSVDPYEDALQHRSKGPMHEEIQAAKRRLRLAQTEEGKREALREVQRLAQVRKAKLEQGKVA